MDMEMFSHKFFTQRAREDWWIILLSPLKCSSKNVECKFNWMQLCGIPFSKE
jgi:hypothetical protein